MADKLTQLVKGKYVLIVPTYSMRSYETGLYDLNCDGNFARVASFINQCEADNVCVTVPHDFQLVNDDYTRRIKYDRDVTVEFAPIDGYGKNAAETRESAELAKVVCDIADAYDIVIFEQQTVGRKLIADDEIDNDKLVYWCVASHIDGHEIWFVDKYCLIDHFIASKVKTCCANQKQCDYLEGKSFVGFFYDPSTDIRPTIFFPFRLSDPEYHFYDKFIPFMDHLLESQDDACDILVTDPNNSIDETRLGHQRPLVVPSDHRLYMSILKGKPIIPYFADVDVIRHISIEEMVAYGACVICYDNDTYKMCRNVHMASSDEQFVSLLKHAIQRSRDGLL